MELYYMKSFYEINESWKNRVHDIIYYENYTLF